MIKIKISKMTIQKILIKKNLLKNNNLLKISMIINKKIYKKSHIVAMKKLKISKKVHLFSKEKYI